MAHSVLPLPEDLKAGATVVTYDSKTGARKVLRKGTNMIECQTRDADGFTSCYPKMLAPRSDLAAKLRAEGKSREEVQPALAAAREVGTIAPPPSGSMFYRLYEEDDRIKAPVGHVAAQRDVRGARHADRKPARQLARQQREAVDDAPGDTQRAPHDPDQRD